MILLVGGAPDDVSRKWTICRATAREVLSMMELESTGVAIRMCTPLRLVLSEKEEKRRGGGGRDYRSESCQQLGDRSIA